MASNTTNNKNAANVNNAPMGGATDKVAYAGGGEGPMVEMLNSYRIRPWITKPHDFNTGCCSCFDDCGNCCDTFWCWHLQLTSQYEVVTSKVKFAKRNWSYCLLMMCADFCTGGVASAVCVALTRYSVRKSFGMPCDCATGCKDCLMWWCCGPCMVCQNHREMHMRGYFAQGCCSSPRNEWLYPNQQPAGGIMLPPQSYPPPAENPSHQPAPYYPPNNGGDPTGSHGYAPQQPQQPPPQYGYGAQPPQYGYNQPPPQQAPYGNVGGDQSAFNPAQVQPV